MQGISSISSEMSRKFAVNAGFTGQTAVNAASRIRPLFPFGKLFPLIAPCLYRGYGPTMQDEDLAARKHTAAHDPAFPERRERAFAAILQALEGALLPQGYALKGTTFSRTSAQGRSAVHLQRSRYGWDAQILLRFVTPDGDRSNHPDWPEEEDLTLWHFVPDLPCDPGTLAFVDILDAPETLTRALDLLTARALPWLDALHDG